MLEVIVRLSRLIGPQVSQHRVFFAVALNRRAAGQQPSVLFNLTQLLRIFTITSLRMKVWESDGCDVLLAACRAKGASL